MKTGWFSEAVGENPSLFASSCYFLGTLPNIMMPCFLVCLLQLIAHNLQLFILLGVRLGGGGVVCICAHPVRGYSAICYCSLISTFVRLTYSDNARHKERTVVSVNGTAEGEQGCSL